MTGFSDVKRPKFAVFFLNWRELALNSRYSPFMRHDHERLSRAPAENLDEAIDEALEGELRASQLSGYVEALQHRQNLITRDLEVVQDAKDREILQRKLDEIDEQIQVLREEENITKFVEEAVKFSYEVRRLSEG